MHGILVQLPLPKSLDTEAIINAIDPAKDVDGLHPNNAGRLAGGLAALSPCTPLGCIILTKSVHASLEGMNAIVIGRSNLVGRPLVQLLLNENATVTIAHSRSRDLAQLCARADLVYAAVGRPEMVRGDWIKPGATVIDVGINRLPGTDGKDRLVGDVAFAEASGSRRRDHAGARRRRPDDGGVPAGQHAARGVRDSRAGEAGGVSPSPLPLAGEAKRVAQRGEGELSTVRVCASFRTLPIEAPHPDPLPARAGRGSPTIHPALFSISRR